MPVRSVALSLSLFVALGLASCSNRTQEPEVTALIGPAGGMVEVTEGELAGAALIIPAGALDREERFTISLTSSSISPGFEQAERAVGFGPIGFRFLRPVTLRIPFVDQTGIVRVVSTMANQMPSLELGPTDVPIADRAEVQALELTNAWPAFRQFRSPGSPDNEVDLFFPLQDGNTWTFDNGLTATLTASTTEPNFDAVPLFLLELTDGTDSLTLYLQREMRTTALLGAVLTEGSDSVQNVFGAANFLPNNVTYLIQRLNVFRYDEFDPLGATTATASGNGEFQSLFENGADIDTPVGLFDDTMSITFVLTLTPDGGDPRSIPFRMTLARDTGPVELDLFGVSAVLQSGTVNGTTLGT